MSNPNSDSERQVQDLLGQVSEALTKNISILQELNQTVKENSRISTFLNTAKEQFVELCNQFKIPDDHETSKSKRASSSIQIVEPASSSN